MKDKIRSKIDSEKKRMKYFKMTLQYSNKYIWYLLLLAVCPSVLTAFVFSPYGTIDFFAISGRFTARISGRFTLSRPG